MVGLNGGFWKSRPCYYIKKKSFDKDYPHIVLWSHSKGYDEYQVNDQGRLRGQYHDSVAISNMEEPLLTNEGELMILKDFLIACCKIEGFEPEHLSVRFVEEKKFGSPVAHIDIGNSQYRLEMVGNKQLKYEIQTLVKEAKKAHYISALAGINE